MTNAEILNQILTALLPIILAICTYLGARLKTKYEEKINTDIKKTVVKETVAYVQQLYGALEGPEKLQKAIEQASLLLTEKGITISEVELNMLIESAVYGLKQGFTTETTNKEA